MPNPVTAGAELGSRCCVTMATGWAAPNEEGTQFLRIENWGRLWSCPSPELCGFENVGGKGRNKGEAIIVLFPQCHCTVGKGERHFFLNINLRKHLASCELSCLVSGRLDNPTPTWTGGSFHNLPPLLFASQLLCWWRVRNPAEWLLMGKNKDLWATFPLALWLLRSALKHRHSLGHHYRGPGSI